MNPDSLHHYKNHFFTFCMLLSLIPVSCSAMQPEQSYSSSVWQSFVNAKVIAAIAGGTALTGITWYAFSKESNPRRYYWDWNKIDTSHLIFPKDFLWGIGTSAHQVEGNCTNNNWAEWEQSTDEEGNPRVKEPAGIACDHWNRYKEDIQLMKALGVDVYRFSVEWSKVEPQEGQFDEEALSHYEDLCNELIAHEIKPVICLHHYTDPLWFAKKGDFEKEKNIGYFVRFCSKVFERMNDKAYLWVTFNSMSGYAAKGYLIGTNPPGKKNMQLMAEVLKNMVEAHVQAYQALKAIRPAAQIGLLKNVYQLEPWNAWNPLDNIAAYIGTMLVSTAMYNFFTTGTFRLYVPFKATIYHVNKNAPSSLDFIGLNYYSHAFMKGFKAVASPHEQTTDNPNYTIYPEGLYRAIKEISNAVARPLGIPLYVTENGIATTDDSIRDLFLRRYLYALNKAIADGYDVRGYFHWALLDNYEWGSYDKKYGVYALDRETQERMFKPGAQYLVNTIKAQK